MHSVEDENSTMSFHDVKGSKNEQQSDEQNKNNSSDDSKCFYTIADRCMRVLSRVSNKKNYTPPESGIVGVNTKIKESQVYSTVFMNSVKVLSLLELLHKKKYRIAISGATSGIGKTLSEQLEGDFIPVGGRNEVTLSQVAESANDAGDHVGGSLFEAGTPAYKYYTELLPSINTGGVAYICSSQDMDPIPMLVDSGGEIVTDTGKILGAINSRGKLKPEMKALYGFVPDYYNPKTGKKWEGEHFNDAEIRMELRRNMADEQIHFFEDMFQSLANGEMKQNPLILVVTNSIISKFKENHSFKHSQYGRLKQRIGQLCEEYGPPLEAKNIYVKNVLLGVVDTPMWQRGVLSQGSTARIVDALGACIPMGGEKVPVEKPLDPDCVAKSIRDIGESFHQHLPRVITLYTREHLDIDRKKQEYQKKQVVLLELIRKKIGDVISVKINDDIKDWLRTLRKEVLEKYAVDAGLQMKRFGSNMSALESIITKLPEEVSYTEFLNICYRIEGNFP